MHKQLWLRVIITSYSRIVVIFIIIFVRVPIIGFAILQRSTSLRRPWHRAVVVTFASETEGVTLTVTVRVAVVVTVTVTGFAVGAGVLCALWQPAKNTQPNVKNAACLRMNITCFFA